MQHQISLAECRVPGLIPLEGVCLSPSNLTIMKNSSAHFESVLSNHCNYGRISLIVIMCHVAACSDWMSFHLQKYNPLVGSFIKKTFNSPTYFKGAALPEFFRYSDTHSSILQFFCCNGSNLALMTTTTTMMTTCAVEVQPTFSSACFVIHRNVDILPGSHLFIIFCPDDVAAVGVGAAPGKDHRSSTECLVCACFHFCPRRHFLAFPVLADPASGAWDLFFQKWFIALLISQGSYKSPKNISYKLEWFGNFKIWRHDKATSNISNRRQNALA